MARPQFIGVSDAAFRLRQTARRTYDMLFSGQLRGARHGNRWLVDLASVQQLERELGLVREDVKEFDQAS